MQKTFYSLCIIMAAIFSQMSLAQEADTVEYYTPNPEAPFSAAVRVGNMLYLSGQIGRDPATGKLAIGGVEAETHQTMKNIKTVLERYGSSMGEVVKCTVFMADPTDRPVIDKAYRSYFGENPPVRSGVGNLIMALDAQVEIECWATVELEKVN